MIIKVYQDDSGNGAVQVQVKTKPLRVMTAEEIKLTLSRQCRQYELVC